MTVIEEAQEVLAKMPKESTWDDVFYHLYVRQRIDLGREEAKAGAVYTQEEAKKILGIK